MPIEISSDRGSTSYIGTFDCSDKSDMEQLEVVRVMVKILNKDLRDSGFDQQYYVKAQGRGPRQGVRRYNQSLPLTFAERVDAYIYKR